MEAKSKIPYLETGSSTTTYPLVHGLLCHTSKNESINARPESLETRPSSRPSCPFPKVVFEQQRIPPSFSERYLPNDLRTSLSPLSLPANVRRLSRSVERHKRREEAEEEASRRKNGRGRDLSPRGSLSGWKERKETAEFPGES